MTYDSSPTATWPLIASHYIGELNLYNYIKDGGGRDDPLGGMKQAAIDAYMKTEHDHWYSDFSILEAAEASDPYPLTTFPNGYYRYAPKMGDIVYWERPGPYGKGGGTAYKITMSSRTVNGDDARDNILERAPEHDHDFSHIPREIDYALERFWDLPATGKGYGDDFGPATDIADDLANVAGWLGLPQRSALGECHSDLADTIGYGTDVATNGYLGRDITQPHGFQAHAFQNWSEQFAGKLPSVVGAYSNIAAWIATTVASQAQAWHVAKANVIEAINVAGSNFRNVAFSGGDLQPWQATFCKILVDTSENFLKGTKLGAVAAAIIDDTHVDATIKESIDASTADPSRNYDSVMDSFKKALEKIDDDITDVERQISSTANRLRERVQGDPSHYTLRHDSKEGEGVDSGTIAITTNPDGSVSGFGDLDLDYDAVTDVVHDLQTAHDVIAAAASLVASHEDDVYTVFKRGPEVGMGRLGPGQAVQEFTIVLGEFLNNLVYEITASQESILAVFWMMMQTDASLAQKITNFHADFYQLYAPQYAADPRAIFDSANGQLAGASPQDTTDDAYDYIREQIRRGLEG